MMSIKEYWKRIFKAKSEVVVTWDDTQTKILAVTRQNEEGQILKVIAKAPSEQDEYLAHLTLQVQVKVLTEELETYLNELAQCRDAIPVPTPGHALEASWIEAVGNPLAVSDYVKKYVDYQSAKA